MVSKPVVVIDSAQEKFLSLFSATTQNLTPYVCHTYCALITHGYIHTYALVVYPLVHDAGFPFTTRRKDFPWNEEPQLGIHILCARNEKKHTDVLVL